MLITLRGPVWRVRILIHGDRRIRWRAYRAADYPTPDAVARRCAEGLSRRGEDKGHDDHDTECEQDVTHHGGPLRVRWECWGTLESIDRASEQQEELPTLSDSG